MDQAIPDGVLEGKYIERKYVDRRSQTRVPASELRCAGPAVEGSIEASVVSSILFRSSE